jgi:hypothetical protein
VPVRQAGVPPVDYIETPGKMRGVATQKMSVLLKHSRTLNHPGKRPNFI